jgi:hypothetical protein
MTSRRRCRSRPPELRHAGRRRRQAIGLRRFVPQRGALTTTQPNGSPG